MFDHSPGDSQSVKGTRTSSDLVKDQKASGCSVSEDIGNLRHLHHEGTLSAGKVVRRSHTGKDPVHNADVRIFRRDKTSHLRHEHDQRSLTHVSGFTGHIGACDNRHPLFLAVQIGIVGNEHIVFDHLLHHRMTSVPDIDHTVFIDLRPYIIVSLGHESKGSKYVQGGHRLGSTLDPCDFSPHFVPDVTEQLILQRIEPVLRAKDQILQLFQLLGDISFRIGERLLAHIIFRYKILKGIGNFQRIAENTVIFDLQVLNTCPLFLSRFQFGKPFLAVCAGTAEFIHILVISLPDDTALSLNHRRFVHDGFSDKFGQILQRIHVFADAGKYGTFEFLQYPADMGKHFQRRGKSHHISGIGRLITDPADQTFQVVHRIQILPDLVPENRILIQLFQSLQPVVDLIRIDKRLLHIGTESSRSHGGFCFIKHP